MNQTPAEENVKLAKIFNIKATWAGFLKAGALGPGSPEMPTSGTYDSKTIADRFWYVCDMDIAFGAGNNSLHWKGHMAVGWNEMNKTYSAVLVDNLGIYLPMTGEMKGEIFILTSTIGNTLNGKKTKARFTWDFSQQDNIQFTNEHQADDGPWQLFEVETIKPVWESKL